MSDSRVYNKYNVYNRLYNPYMNKKSFVSWAATTVTVTGHSTCNCNGTPLPLGRLPCGAARWRAQTPGHAVTVTVLHSGEFVTRRRPGARFGGRTVITPSNLARPTAGPRATVSVAASGGPVGPDPTP